MAKGKRKGAGGTAQSFTVLNGRHELAVRRLTATAERVELAYRITPALPERWRDNPDGSLDAAGPPVFFSVEGVDDLGREYLDGGGAFGTDPEGGFTEGSLSLEPGPAPEARSLTLTLMLTCGDEQSTHQLTMPL